MVTFARNKSASDLELNKAECSLLISELAFLSSFSWRETWSSNSRLDCFNLSFSNTSFSIYNSRNNVLYLRNSSDMQYQNPFFEQNLIFGSGKKSISSQNIITSLSRCFAFSALSSSTSCFSLLTSSSWSLSFVISESLRINWSFSAVLFSSSIRFDLVLLSNRRFLIPSVSRLCRSYNTFRNSH